MHPIRVAYRGTTCILNAKIPSEMTGDDLHKYNFLQGSRIRDYSSWDRNAL